MVSRRKSTLGQQAVEATLAGMGPELRAAYERIYRRELEYREELFRQYPTFLVNEIPSGYGHSVPTMFIRCWIRERQCFAYRHNGRYRFPAFQFANGIPKAAIRRVIPLLCPMDGWVMMYWFAAANGWLDEGATPLSVLDSDPE